MALISNNSNNYISSIEWLRLKQQNGAQSDSVTVAVTMPDFLVGYVNGLRLRCLFRLPVLSFVSESVP